jgi:hypothetical protein
MERMISNRALQKRFTAVTELNRHGPWAGPSVLTARTQSTKHKSGRRESSTETRNRIVLLVVRSSW